MPPFGPISRSRFVSSLKQLGFDGPFAGGNHEYLAKGFRKVRVPNPHRGDIGAGLLNRLLRQAGITREEWERL